MELQTEKKLLRKKVGVLTGSMKPGSIREKSKSIIKNILSLECWKSSDAVFCFLSFGSEPETDELIEKTLKSGKTAGGPVLTGNSMFFCRLEGLNPEQLTLNSFGIREPVSRRELRPEQFRFPLMIIPGLAFSADGRRLGRGGGYYDRYLAGITKNTVKIGVCFENILSVDIPAETHDITMDYIVTEKTVYKTKS